MSYIQFVSEDNMKEKIYTIPLSESYEEDCECPFCFIEQKLEREQVEYSLGASMMEPDSRIISNEKGFCRRHFKAMLEKQEALSLALVLDTHLNEVVKNLKEAKKSTPSKKLFKKEDDDKIVSVLKKVNSSCVICEKIDFTMKKFANVFWYLYKTEEEFKNKVLASKGFCLPHFQLVMSMIDSELSGKQLACAREEIIDLEIKNLERVNEDVNWFTKKFDYRFTNEPWKNSKDAPQRTISKLSKF